MFIKMLRDQVRPWGIFLRGQTHSLPARDVANLDVDSYVEVEVDEARLKELDTAAKVQHLNNELSRINAAITVKKRELAELTSKRKDVTGKIKQIEAKAADADKEVTSDGAKPDDETDSADKGAAQESEPAKTKTDGDAKR